MEDRVRGSVARTIDRRAAASMATGAVLAFVAVLSTVAVTRWAWAIVGNRARALDASDEAYQLVLALDPSVGATVPNDFGHYLGVLLTVTGSTLAGVRVAGLVLLVAAAVFVAWCVTPRVSSRSRQAVLVVMFAVTLASIALSYYAPWQPTPSYNWAVALTVMCAAALTARCTVLVRPVPDGMGLPTFEATPQRASLVALGACLVVAAAAKPTSGLATLVLAAAIFLVVHGRRGAASRSVWIAVGLAVGAVVHVTIVGLPWHDVSKLFEVVGTVDAERSHRLADVLEYPRLWHVYGSWFAWYALGAGALWWTWRRVPRLAVRRLVVVAGTLATAVFFAADLPSGGEATLVGSTGWWWVRLTALTLLWTAAAGRGRSRTWAVGPLVAAMAVGASLGSNNGLVRETALSAGVLAVGVVVQAVVVGSTTGGGSRRMGLIWLPVVAFFAVGAVASIELRDTSLRTPYRIGYPMTPNTERVDLPSLGHVDVTVPMQIYLDGLRAMTPLVPEEARDCLVDLAGGTPVTSLALDVRPAGSAWLVGGYPGSAAAVDRVLERADCLDGPYVLIEAPDGTRRVPPPDWLDTSGKSLLGVVHYGGYLEEDQYVYLVPRGRAPT